MNNNDALSQLKWTNALASNGHVFSGERGILFYIIVQLGILWISLKFFDKPVHSHQCFRKQVYREKCAWIHKFISFYI